MDVPNPAWLFTRGPESIRITRLGPLTLVMCGPGRRERSYTFDNDAALEQFRQSHAQQLATEGWAEHPMSDRRASSRKEPSVAVGQSATRPQLPHAEQ
jgi:hypothetical protein